jgi:hypothetical protein
MVNIQYKGKSACIIAFALLSVAIAVTACASSSADRGAQHLLSDQVIMSDVGKFTSNQNFQYPFFAADGGHKLARTTDGALHAVFVSNNATVNSLMYARSADNGLTWITEDVVSVNDLINLYDSNKYIVYPSIAANGTDIYIAYAANESGNPLDRGINVVKRTAPYGLGSQIIQSFAASNDKTFFTDIAVHNGNVYIAAVFLDNTDKYKVGFYRGAENITLPFTPESVPNPPAGDAFTPFLATAQNGDLYLAFDVVGEDNVETATKKIQINKRASGGGWSIFADVVNTDTAYRVQHANIAYNEVSNKLHVVYSKHDSYTDFMSLGYREYTAAGALDYRNENIVGLTNAVFTPQITFVASSAAPVVQYVGLDGYDFRIMQTSYHLGTWAAPRVSDHSTNQAVYLHTLPVVQNKQINMLWYDLSSVNGLGTVHAATSSSDVDVLP